ncbi:MAG: hypothetical protein ISR83_08920 [Candidatus Marinimicrobia bacterium]|nr:hypothetical protein [Candidatus Neomarinimicrobiota bacterium]
MKNTPLLSELELKIKELVSALERSREKAGNGIEQEGVSEKLSLIEDHVKNLIQLLDQIEES